MAGSQAGESMKAAKAIGWRRGENGVAESGPASAWLRVASCHHQRRKLAGAGGANKLAAAMASAAININGWHVSSSAASWRQRNGNIQ